MLINRIYEIQNFLSLSLGSFLVRLRTYQHPCITYAGTKYLKFPLNLHTAGYNYDICTSYMCLGTGSCLPVWLLVFAPVNRRMIRSVP